MRLSPITNPRRGVPPTAALLIAAMCLARILMAPQSPGLTPCSKIAQVSQDSPSMVCARGIETHDRKTGIAFVAALPPLSVHSIDVRCIGCELLFGRGLVSRNGLGQVGGFFTAGANCPEPDKLRFGLVFLVHFQVRHP